MRFFLLLLLLVNLFADENIFDEAGKYYDVSPQLLYAIAKTESSLNPNAINCANTNKSCDYGIMQINSIHLPLLKKHGISKNDLFNPKINIYIGAWVLKNCINKHGGNYKALNCYNGKIKNNPYYTKVLKNYYKTQAIAKNQSNTNDILQSNTTNYKILVIGDSMAQGLTPQIQNILKNKNTEVISKYKIGSSSNYWAKQNITSLIQEQKANVVLVALGTNEFKNPYFTDTEQIVSELQNAGVEYKWILPIYSGATQYNSFVSNLVGAENVIANTEQLELYSDGIHPTPNSFKKWSYVVLNSVFDKERRN